MVDRRKKEKISSDEAFEKRFSNWAGDLSTEKSLLNYKTTVYNYLLYFLRKSSLTQQERMFGRLAGC